MFTNRTIRKHRSGIWNRKRIVDSLRRLVLKTRRVEFHLSIFLPEGVYEDLTLEELNEAVCKGIRSLPQVGYRNICATELVDEQTECRSGKAS